MTAEIKELVADLNDLQILPPMECIEDYNNAHGRKLYGRAADALEAMAGEVERLTINGIHSCWEECPRLPCVQGREIRALTAERDRLKAALETIAHDNVPREVFIVWRTDGSNSKHDKCQHMRMMYEDCGNCTALFARKALGDAS